MPWLETNPMDQRVQLLEEVRLDSPRWCRPTSPACQLQTGLILGGSPLRQPA